MKSVFRTGYLIRQIITPLMLFALTVLFFYIGVAPFAVAMGIGGVILLLRFLGWNCFRIELREEDIKITFPLSGQVILRKYKSLKRIAQNRRTLEGDGMVQRTNGRYGPFSKFRNLELYFKDGYEIWFSEDHFDNFEALRKFLIQKKEESLERE